MLTPLEIEQISDRFVAITQQLSEEVRTQQEQTNKLIEDLRDRLGEYLSSLNLFHLDHQGSIRLSTFAISKNT